MKEEEEVVPQLNWLTEKEVTFTKSEETGKTRIVHKDGDIEIEVCATMGKGRFCKVVKAVADFPNFNETGIPYALKIFNKGLLKSEKVTVDCRMSDMLKETSAEFDLHKKLANPNVAKMCYIFEKGMKYEEGKYYVAMHLGDLGVVAYHSDETFDSKFTLN